MIQADQGAGARSLPPGLSRREDGALRVQGIDGEAVLLPPAAQDPGALETGLRLLVALGGPEPAATQPIGAEPAVPAEPAEPAVAAEPAAAAGGPAEPPESAVPAESAVPVSPTAPAEPVAAAGGPEEGGAPGTPGGAAPLLTTGVWVDPDEGLLQGLGPLADGAPGTARDVEPAAGLDTGASPERIGATAPTDPAGPAGPAGAAGPGTAAAPSGAMERPPSPSAADLPVFSGFPDPEPGSGRRRRSPRSALSAAAASPSSASSARSAPSGGSPVREPVRPAGAPDHSGGARDQADHRADRRGGSRAGGPGEGGGDHGGGQVARITRPSPQILPHDPEAERSTQVVPAALAALGAAPIVLASMCPQGHANPPDLGQCVRCGQVLPGDLRQVPRPVLVTLSVSGGEQVPVAGDVVVGRAPQPPAGADPYLVALVSVSSPTHLVSRSHLMLTTAEWNVFAQDLESSNGTVLVRPGHGAVLLAPRAPTPLLVGDLLDVGDGVTISIEAPR